MRDKRQSKRVILPPNRREQKACLAPVASIELNASVRENGARSHVLR